MDRLDQCQREMCQEQWSIYMDQLKLLDEKVEARLDSKTSAKNDDMEQPDSTCNEPNTICKLILDGSEKWKIKKSDITGIDEHSTELFESTRFSVNDFYKAGARGNKPHHFLLTAD